MGRRGFELPVVPYIFKGVKALGYWLVAERIRQWREETSFTRHFYTEFLIYSLQQPWERSYYPHFGCKETEALQG